MVVIIKKLIWEPANIRHIARHMVSPDEVEELIQNYHIAKTTYKNRITMLGETDTGRILELVLVRRGSGKFYPLTCYEPAEDMVALYKRMKGVSTND